MSSKMLESYMSTLFFGIVFPGRKVDTEEIQRVSNQSIFHGVYVKEGYLRIVLALYVFISTLILSIVGSAYYIAENNYTIGVFFVALTLITGVLVEKNLIIISLLKHYDTVLLFVPKIKKITFLPFRWLIYNNKSILGFFVPKKVVAVNRQ